MTNTYTKKILHPFFTVPFLALCITIFSTMSLAYTEWAGHKSKTGIYITRIPDNFKVKTTELFPIGKGRAVGAEAISSIIDERPFKDVFRYYDIKFEQTLGKPFSNQEVAILLKQELDLYENFYVSKEGEVKSRNDNLFFKGYDGGETYISYIDPDIGEQSIKIRVLFTDVSKLTQIIAGPDSTIHSFKAREFFESLQVSSGFAIAEDKIEDLWTPLTPPMNLFTAKIPPLSNRYFPKEPQISQKTNADFVNLIFTDPVRKQNIFVNLYGYRISAELDYNRAEKVLKRRHIQKHRSALYTDMASLKRDSVGIKRKINDMGEYIEAQYNIHPLKKFPYMDRIKIRAYFYKNFMLVEEVIGSSPLIFSPFIENFLKEVKFHPEHYGHPILPPMPKEPENEKDKGSKEKEAHIPDEATSE